MNHRTHVLTSGAVVHHWSPYEPAPNRGAVVIQHGFGEYAERYLTLQHGLIGHLAGAGFEVWALDLWGHGRSPGRRGVCHVGHAVTDHRDVLALASVNGLPVAALGHSLGGLVTAASVAEYDGDLAAVVLLSPALPAAMPRLGRRLLGIAAGLAPGVAIPERRRPLEELSHRPEIIRATASDRQMYDGQIGFLLAATALDAMEGLRAHLGAWSPPCLIVHGTADTYTDPAGSAELAARIGDQAELRQVADGFHELLSDTDGDLVLDVVLAFLATRMSG